MSSLDALLDLADRVDECSGFMVRWLHDGDDRFTPAQREWYAVYYAQRAAHYANRLLNCAMGKAA